MAENATRNPHNVLTLRGAVVRDARTWSRYLHDQTLRLGNQGYTGAEIAEMMLLSPEFDRAWHARGYYGSVSRNVMAIYQRYLGRFDGNPAHLWLHPPEEAARRYVDCLGGTASG